MRRPLLGLVVAVATAAATPAAHADVVPEYFNTPAGISAGEGLDAAPDGILYFGASDNTEQPPIGRLTMAQALPGTANGITTVKTPDDTFSSGSALIRDVSYSPLDHALYWTRSDFVAGTLKAGVADKTLLPVPPWGIAAASDGGAWLAEWGAGGGPNTPARPGSRIARLGSGLGLQELRNIAAPGGVFASIRFDAKPKDIAVDPATGTAWFVEEAPGFPGYRIAKVVGDDYVEYSAPCVSQDPCSGMHSGADGLDAITVGLDGSVWYTDTIKKVIGRLMPDLTIHEYTLNSFSAGLSAGKPRGLDTAPDGSILVANYGSFGAPGANAIIRIVPLPNTTDVQSTVWKLGAGFSPWEVSVDAGGTVWFSGSPQPGSGPSLGRLASATGSGPVGGGTGGTPIGGGGTQQPPTTVKAATSGTARITKPTVQDTSISANQICVGPPEDRCSLVYLIQTHEYVKGFPNTNGLAAAAAKPTLTTIGKLTVTLKGGQSKKVTVKLNSKGVKLLKKIKKFKATLTVTQTIKGQKTPKTVLKKNVTFKKKK